VGVPARERACCARGRKCGTRAWGHARAPVVPVLARVRGWVWVGGGVGGVRVGVWVVVRVCVLRESARVCVRAAVRACVCVCVCVRAGVCVRVGVWVCVRAQKPYS
jgi:hypothetical protein